MMSNTKKITCDCGNTNPKKLNYFPIASEVKAELYFCKNCKARCVYLFIFALKKTLFLQTMY